MNQKSPKENQTGSTAPLQNHTSCKRNILRILELLFFAVLLGYCIFLQCRLNRSNKAEQSTPVPTTPLAIPAEIPATGEISISPAEPASTQEEEPLPEIRYPSLRGEFDEGNIYRANTISMTLKNVQADHLTLENLTIRPRPKSLKKLEWNRAERHLVITGEFALNTEHTVQIRGNIQTDRGVPISSTLLAIIPALKPESLLQMNKVSSYLPVSFAELEKKPVVLEIEYAGIQTASVTLYRQSQRNLTLPYGQNRQQEFMRKIGEKPLKLSDNDPAHRVVQRIDISDLLKGQKPGLYKVVIESPEHKTYWWDESVNAATIVFSDLGIAFTASEKNAAVSVRSLQKGNPVTGAKVQLYSQKQTLMSEGTTGEDGTALLTYSPLCCPEEETPKTLIVTHGDDCSYLPLHELSPHSTAAYQESPHRFTEKPEAFLSTERGIYRPGEAVHCSLILRHVQQKESRPWQGKCFLLLRNNGGEILAKNPVRTDENGLVSTEISLPRTLPDGVYSLLCCLDAKKPQENFGTCQFQVGTFQPDRIELKLSPKTSLISAPQLPAWNIQAQTYYGTPLEDAQVQLRYQLTLPAVPLHWKEYTTALSTAKRHSEYLDTQRNSLKSLSSGIYLRRLPREAETFPYGPLQFQLQATVLEKGSRPVSRQSSVTYLPSATGNLGLTSPRSQDSSVVLQTAALPWEKDGKLQGTATYQMTLSKVEWRYTAVKTENGERYEWNCVPQWTRELPLVQLIDGVSNHPEYTIPNLQDGLYELTAVNLAHSSERITLAFWHEKGDGGSSRSVNPNVLNVKTDKPQYLPGETATITLESDAAGSLLLLAGTQEIQMVQARDIAAGTTTVELPIPSQITTGDYFARLTLLTGNGSNTRRKFGVLRLPLNQNAHRLNLTVTAPAKIPCGTPVTVTVSGTPGASVQLWAVDEGILSLTDYATPNPFDFFFGSRHSTFQSWDLYDRLMPELSLTANGLTGGDQMAKNAAALKSKALQERMDDSEDSLPPNAIFTFPSQMLSPEGTATFTFTPEDFSGSLRILAMGTGADAVGSQAASLLVRDSVVIQPQVPAALAVNDQTPLLFRIEASELTGKKIRCQAWDASLPFPLDALQEGEFRLLLQLPEGIQTPLNGVISAEGEKGILVLSYPIIAVAEGLQKIAFTLQGKSYEKKGVISLPVRSIYPAISRSKWEILQPGNSLTLPPDLQAKGKRTLLLSPGPVSRIRQNLAWLQNYPFNCLEQSTSKNFPYLAMGEAGRAQVEAGALHLLAQLQGRMGFVSWPNSKHLWPEASLYAAHFLLEASPDFLSETQKAQIISFLEMRQESHPEDRAYIAYLLALGKHNASLPIAYRILDAEKNSPSFNTLLAAAALIRMGYGSEGAYALQAALQNKVWEKPDQPLPWIFKTPVCRTAMALSLAAQYSRDLTSIQMLKHHLMTLADSTENEWNTTCENSWAAYALLQAEQGIRQCVLTPEASRILCQITKEDGSSETVDSTQEEIRLETDSRQPLTLKNNGSSPLYLLSRTLQPGSANTLPKGQISVTKEYLQEDGTPVRQWTQGDLLTVRLTFRSPVPLSNAVIEDRLPGCAEIETGALATRVQSRKLPLPPAANAYFKPTEVQCRQDRYLCFGDLQAETCYVLTYQIRILASGKFSLTPAHLEGMYRPDIQGTSPVNETQIQVEPLP